jgi:ribulose-phosphate 3-epimerase
MKKGTISTKMVFPSLIAADLLNLRRELETLAPYALGYHIDIMDNHFVNNLTWGDMFVDAIAKESQKPLWIHLMVDKPEQWIEKLHLPAHSTVSIHIESGIPVRHNLLKIKTQGFAPSLAVNPETPIETVFPYLDLVDLVLIMSVEPGHSGEPYLPKVESKIDALVSERESRGLKCLLGMDGGISVDNIGRLAHKGVDWFAAASAIFGKENRVKALEELMGLLNQ